MINHKSNILKKLYSKPTGNWYPIKKGFSINVDGYLPLSNLNLNFKKQIPSMFYQRVQRQRPGNRRPMPPTRTAGAKLV